MKLSLFVDPGKKAGLAFFCDSTLIKYMGVDGANPYTLHAIISDTTNELTASGNVSIDKCIIEAGYVGINKQASLKLAERRGIVEAIATLCGYKVDYIFCTEWQTILGKKEKSKSKEASKKLASEYTKSNITDDNIADAICQGIYFVKVGPSPIILES